MKTTDQHVSQKPYSIVSIVDFEQVIPHLRSLPVQIQQ